MSSAASAPSSSSSSGTKKVEWYHLDRVAIAKRICLDPAAVKLKNALNNNNNNNNSSYNRHSNASSSSTTSLGTSKSAKTSSAGNAFSGSTTNSNSNNTASNQKTTSSSTSTPFDIVHLLYPGSKNKEQSSSSVTNHTPASSNRVSHSPGESGIFSLRYNTLAFNGNNNSPTPVTNYVTSVAGSRQFAALQQKRRRKAQRLAAAAAGASVPLEKVNEEPTTQQQQQQQQSSFLDEHGLIVHSGIKSSCGSSSRSSSSGVSSDFEELDGTHTTVASETEMKVAASSGTGSRKNGNRQSSCSTSECEDDDDEGAAVLKPPFVPVGKMCKNLGSNSNSAGTSTTAGNISANGNINGGTNNNNNLSNLGVLNSLVMVDGGGVASGGGSGKMGKNGRGSDSGRIINRKNAHQCNNANGGSCKSVHNNSTSHHHNHNNHHCGATTAKTGNNNKMETNNGSSTFNKGKHTIASICSSSASTISGSTDNERDTDISLSELPTDLDFLGVSDKGKRRTDRYDSSESSDSGVATLSPSTSDSPEPTSTCCDFASEHLDVGNLISATRSSSASNTSSYPTSSCSKSSSSSSASTCSGTSTACLVETQGDPPTGSSVSKTSTIEAKLPSSSSTGSEAASSVTVNPPIHETLCQWKGCTCSTEASHNILEHIQTSHVAPQMKSAGYVCLWEGCKVFNKRSSSLSWLERHVLSHSGNKPFKCIFAGCGLSFSSQNALERHVNSHIATNGTTSGTHGNSTVANKKLDSSPAKASRRKKIRFRKQRINIGQRVDYFDKRIMEVIKHWLASSVDQYAVNAHDCTFRGEIIARRVIANCERQVLVRWYPRFVLNDEWMPESKFTKIKLVPLRRIPSDKIRLLYPALFPPQRQEKATRKRKPRSYNMLPPLSPHSTSMQSEGSSSLTTLPPSPNNLSPSEIASLIDTSVSFLNSPTISSRSTRSSSSSSSSSASLCSSFSSSASTSSTSSCSSSQKSLMRKGASNAMLNMMMDTSSGDLKSEVEQDEDTCHKKFCVSSCDCPSALEDVDNNEDADANDPTHWALEVLYEDMGMFLS